MKKVAMALSAAALLAGCAAGGSSGLGFDSGVGMGNSMLKMAVDNQCRTELANRNEWRVVALAMSADKQRAWEDKICGCASEEVLQQTTAGDMAQLLSPATRTQAIAGVTARTVTACVKRLYK